MRTIVACGLAGLMPSTAWFDSHPLSAAEPDKLHRIVLSAPEELQQLFTYTGHPFAMVSSHRGGPGPGFPENCIETFEGTLRYTYSLLEVSPRLSADGNVVIHHDSTLERTTTGTGKLSDQTLAELKQLR